VCAPNSDIGAKRFIGIAHATHALHKMRMMIGAICVRRPGRSLNHCAAPFQRVPHQPYAAPPKELLRFQRAFDSRAVRACAQNAI
jgi:hypothetical protein